MKDNSNIKFWSKNVVYEAHTSRTCTHKQIRTKRFSLQIPIFYCDITGIFLHADDSLIRDLVAAAAVAADENKEGCISVIHI